MAAVPEPEQLVVFGSALGYQCFWFAERFGRPCIGYDLLCASLVRPATEMAKQLGLDALVTFRCESADLAPLPETGVIWVNDYAWDDSVREVVHQRLAGRSPKTTVVLTSKPIDFEASHEVQVSVSWNTDLRVSIFNAEL